MNRFIETEIGKYLNDNFPKVLETILTSTKPDCLPDPKLVRVIWSSASGIMFKDRIQFEELMMFYQPFCETKAMIEKQIIDSKKKQGSNKIIVLCLLAAIGLMCLGYYLFD